MVKNETKQSDDRYFDDEFAQLVEKVNGKRKITQIFDRFAVGNKFNLVEDGKTSFVCLHSYTE